MKKSYLALTLSLFAGLSANAATLIRGFEDRSAGSFTPQYAEFTITTDTVGATLDIQSFAQYASEGSKFLTIMNPATGGGDW